MELDQQSPDSGASRPDHDDPADTSPPRPPEKIPGRSAGSWSASSLIAGIVVGLLLGSAATAATMSSREAARIDDLLTAAFDSCGEPEGIEVTDEGRTMLFDVEGEDESSGASIEDLACMLFDLDIPDSTIANMEQTTSMDGRQSDEWNDFGITWSYHPDRGLDGVVTIIDP